MEMLINLYHSNIWKRTLIFWIFFQIILWLIFGISYLCHNDSWINISENIIYNNDKWLSLFLFIFFNNLILCILIAIGNLFVRFNVITPGLLIIFIQIISIGWYAGSNSFEIPFINVAQANIQYLKVGIWEITAYILTFSLTISKSLNVSSKFLPKKWDTTKKIKDIKFSRNEKVVLITIILLLILAAFIETNSIIFK